MRPTARVCRRVLVVEDDFLTREAMALVLAGQGYAVAAAANGREALDRLRGAERPDLIVLDLMMPVMDGWTFRRQQQADRELSDIPVLVVSAAGDLREKAGDLGACACLQKPVESEDLLDAVRRHCRLAGEGCCERE